MSFENDENRENDGLTFHFIYIIDVNRSRMILNHLEIYKTNCPDHASTSVDDYSRSD